MKWRNEKDEITTDRTEIQTIIREYYEQLYANILDKLEEMDKFLETYSSPRLRKKQIIWTDQLVLLKLNQYFKKLPKNKSPELDDFTGEFYQAYKEELIPIFLKLFQKE